MESFLPRLIVDIANSPTESLVSCPEIMSGLDASNTWPVTQMVTEVDVKVTLSLHFQQNEEHCLPFKGYIMVP